MFEAYARNKYTSTGVIQWMLNNAWPSMIWHLYDYYLRPGGGYFGTKKACEPLHVQFSYDDRSVVVVNDLQEAFKGLKVSAELLEPRPRVEVLGQRASSTSAADGVVRALTVPKPKDLTATYFLRLKLEDAAGQLRSSNLYWLSTREDVLDWKKTEWYYTPDEGPRRPHGARRARPRRRWPRRAALRGRRARKARAVVSLENTGKVVAFQVRLKLVDADERRRDPAGLLGRQLLRALPRREALGSRRVPARPRLRQAGGGVPEPGTSRKEGAGSDAPTPHLSLGAGRDTRGPGRSPHAAQRADGGDLPLRGGEERSAERDASPRRTRAPRWKWATPATAGWDTALLGVRVDAGAEPEPWVEIAAGSARTTLYLDAGARGAALVEPERAQARSSRPAPRSRSRPTALASKPAPPRCASSRTASTSRRRS